MEVFSIFPFDMLMRNQEMIFQQSPCYAPHKNPQNSSCLVTPREKRSSLVSHPASSVVRTTVAESKKGIPTDRPFTGNLSESLDFKPFPCFYFCSLDINTTHSTCDVCGNISTGCISFAIYPNVTKNAMSLARVAGLQDT